MDATQPNLFDWPPPTPADVKESAIRQVAKSSRAFVEAAFGRLEQVSRRQQFLSSLDVWNACEDLERPNHPRAMGPVMQRGVRAGFLRATSRTVKTGQASNHDQEIRVWESTIWKRK
jgi:hypothetical protein